MVIGVFFSVAGLLVVFGGLLAAADSALSVLSRNDLVELAASSRSRRSLLAISADPGAHVNALNFMRIVAETTAAVLVTLAFASIFTDWWWTLLASALIMTAASFVLVGSSPRSVGRVNARPVMRVAAPIVRATRVILGPLADALVAIGNRVTPGRPRTATFSSEEQLLSMIDEATELDVLEEDDRELIHSIFEFNDTVVREVMIPRTDMVTLDADATMTASLGLFLSKGVSRMPVIGEDVDEVIGVLYLKDVARVVHEHALDHFTLADALVIDLLDAFDARIDRSVVHVCSKGGGKQVAVDQGLLMTHHDGLAAELVLADRDGLHGRRSGLRQKGDGLCGHIRTFGNFNGTLRDLHTERHTCGAAALFTVLLGR